MGILSAVGDTIKRYGSNVNILENGESTLARAVIEPLRYKNRVYVGGQYHIVGIKRTEKYLYIGPPEYTLTENLSVIEMNGSKYIVKRCELYYVKDFPVYVWAILQPYGSALEDDYESD